MSYSFVAMFSVSLSESLNLKDILHKQLGNQYY